MAAKISISNGNHEYMKVKLFQALIIPRITTGLIED